MTVDTMATVEVKVPITLTVKLGVEFASETELRRHIERNRGEVLRGIEKSIGVSSSWSSCGWLDDDHEAFVDDLLLVDADGPLTIVKATGDIVTADNGMQFELGELVTIQGKDDCTSLTCRRMGPPPGPCLGYHCARCGAATGMTGHKVCPASAALEQEQA